jgi:rhodanese-related sulfurtransferase
MFYEWKRRLRPFFLALIILGACFAGTGGGAMGAAQVSGVSDAAIAWPREINVRQAREKLDSGAFFLDVREIGEWSAARIPGAVLVPLNQLQAKLDEIPRDKEIVVVCASGSRSKMALDILRKEGFEKSSSMSGGIRIWKQVGYPIEVGK